MTRFRRSPRAHPPVPSAAPAAVRSPSNFHRAWYLLLAAGAAAIVVYNVLPIGLPADGVYLLIGLAGVVAIDVGAAVNRPAQRAPWVAMGVGQLLWVSGDAVSSYLGQVLHSTAFPTAADFLYLAAYPLLALGLALLIHGRRPRRDVAGVLDSAIVTCGLALLSWTLIARPTLQGYHDRSFAASVAVAYPVADILLVGVAMRLITTAGGRTPAFRLLLSAVSVLVAADSVSTSLGLYASGSNRAVDSLWLASYLLWGAAALHPSMRTLSRAVRVTDITFSRRRLIVLGLATLVAPATLATQRLRGVAIDAWAISIGSAVLVLLVVARMTVSIEQILAANRQREQLQSALAYQAEHDSLTGLPNRARAMELITGALLGAQRRGAMTGLLFIDLDGFKVVNDTLGHAAGDRVLQTIGARMQSCVRSGDVVARLGGDEFVVLLEHVGNESEVLDVARRIVATAAEPIGLSGAADARVGASVGVAFSVDGSTDAEALLHEADTAVYRAKQGGRGRAEIFGEHIRAELAERGERELALAAALRDDELVLDFEPIFDLGRGVVCGYDAVVHRIGSDGQPVRRPQFLNVGDRSDLVCDVDAWVLDRSLEDLSQRDAETGMTVPVTARHLGDPRIIRDVVGALTAHHVAASRLTLAVTESDFRDDPRALYHLDELRRRGVTIRMDDYGSGNNSVVRLGRLPIDALAVEPEALADNAAAAHELFRLLVRAVDALGLSLIVQGIDDEDTLDLARSQGCRFGRGSMLGLVTTSGDRATSA